MPRAGKMRGVERGAVRADQYQRRVAFERVGHPLAEIGAALRVQLAAETRGALREERMRRVGRAP